MLNKQGLFHRGNESNATRTANTLSTLSSARASSVLSSSTPSSAAEPEPVAEKKPAEPRVDTSSGSRLIVGPDVKLRGAEIQDCDTLVVEGRVEATMDSRVIQISEHGAFSGKVGIDVAEVYGQFDGELTARSQLIIHSSGRVSGKIRYGKIFIEEGGELSGDIASLTSEKNKPITSSLRSASGKGD